MFRRSSKPEEVVKALIVQDTFIGGEPVFAGEVIEIEKSTLKLLGEVKRAVAYDKATKDQLALERELKRKEKESLIPA